MGVDGLFPVIAPAMEKVNYFEALNGRTVAEDGFVWLHKDATFSALGLILRQDDTDVIKRFSQRVNKLLDHGVTPFMVFDGKRTTGKLVNAERAKARHEARQTALKLHAAGDKVGAEKWAKQAISVTQSMVYNVIHQVLRPRGIRYCVAQGEADGQIAALQKHGDVDAAASVDGDIIIHGVTEFYTKINYQTGEALRYQSQCWSHYTPPAENQDDAITSMRVALALQETPLRQLMTDQKIIEDSDKLTLSKLKLFLKNNPRFKPPSSVTRRELLLIGWLMPSIQLGLPRL